MNSQESVSSIRQRYLDRLRDLSTTIVWRERRSGLISVGRGLLFLLTILCVIASLTSIFSGVWAYVVPSLPFVALIGLAAFQETIQSRQAIDRSLARIQSDQLRRIDRDWTELSQPQIKIPSDRTNLSTDLDLFGEASLFKLLSLAQTPLGIRRLADWILNPALPPEIQKRQQAVQALRDETDLRDDLQLLAGSVADARTDPDGLLQWAHGGLWLDKRRWLLMLARVTGVIMLAAIVLFFLPFAPRWVAGSVVLFLFVLHFLLTVVFCGQIHQVFNSVGYRQRDISNYVDLFGLAARLDTHSTVLKEIREKLATGKGNAVQSVGRLQGIIGVAQMRRNGLMFIVYLVAQFLFLIDVHTLARLEKWQRRHSQDVQDWLESVAVWEALTSLANCWYHQPGWSLPEVTRGHSVFEATGLGHPLIDDQARVCNDVSVGPRNTLLLVTGSNMSGKSTLLRSIGLNAALAQAGGPVCASRLVMPPLKIETSMRIGDSVSEGVSFFMAELKRLRQITVEAEQLAHDPEWTLLFLLDEILQGTNSKERQIAVIRVCEHLLQAGAIGAISTHDLELAVAQPIASHCRTVHFREFFREDEEGRNQMSFDYRMRNGVSPTTNALKLLELVGLSDPALGTDLADAEADPTERKAEED